MKRTPEASTHTETDAPVEQPFLASSALRFYRVLAGLGDDSLTDNLNRLSAQLEANGCTIVNFAMQTPQAVLVLIHGTDAETITAAIEGRDLAAPADDASGA